MNLAALEAPTVFGEDITHRSDDVTVPTGNSTCNPHEFLAALFAERSGEIFVAFRTCAMGDDVGWKGKRYDEHTSFEAEQDQYYCISELKEGAKSRTEKNFLALRVLALDDIGTKVPREKIQLPATYRLQTSPGNEQWGYLLSEPLTNKVKAKRLIEGCAAVGATDAGGNNLIRWMRLPSGVNTKPERGPVFPQVKMLEWNPTQKYSAEHLARAFNIDLESPRGRPRQELPTTKASDDPIIKLLEELDMVIDAAPNDRGFILIQCPWAAQHTTDKTTAGYMPGGVFKCFHGHCANKRVTDLLEYLREREFLLSQSVDTAVAAFPGPHGGLLRALTRYAYVLQVDAFVDMALAMIVKVEALDRFIANEMRGFKPTKFLLENDALLRVSTVVYLPGKPTILTINETGVPLKVVNTWRSGPIEPARNLTHAQARVIVQPYITHLEWLFPNLVEREIVWNVITHLVQHRGAKINWMLVMLAKIEGAGRDTMLKPVREILGIRNVSTIGTGALFGAFNDYELSELVCFSEADSSSHNRFQIYTELKDKVTDPPPTVSINRKNLARVEQRKVANYVMLTNDPAAVASDSSSRRVCVVETPYSESEVIAYGKTGVFRMIHSLYTDDKWMAAFHQYLLTRGIPTTFDPLGRAPATDATVRMREHARSNVDAYLMEAIADEVGVFKNDLVKLDDVLTQVSILPGMYGTTRNGLAASLQRAGAEPIREFRTSGKKQKWVRGVWAVRNVAVYLAMNDDAKREAWAQTADA